MGKRTIRYDDFEEDVLADETIRFSIDSKTYELDLTAERAELFRKQLAPWVEAATVILNYNHRTAPRGRHGGPRSRKYSSLADRARAAEIRSWALKNGYEVGERGRLPLAVLDAYIRKEERDGEAE